MCTQEKLADFEKRLKEERSVRLAERKAKRKEERRSKWYKEREEEEQRRKDEEAKRRESIYGAIFGYFVPKVASVTLYL